MGPAVKARKRLLSNDVHLWIRGRTRVRKQRCSLLQQSLRADSLHTTRYATQASEGAAQGQESSTSRVPTAVPTVVRTAGPTQPLADREFPLSPCGIWASRRFRHLYHNLVSGFPWLVLSSHYGSRCGSHCGTRCGSRCLSLGCRVSLMVVRDSGGLAVLTSLLQADVAVSVLRSRWARVVSSWLVVGFPRLRGVSCLHPTRLSRRMDEAS